MNDILISVTSEEFHKNVIIKFPNILDGLDTFPNFTLEPKNVYSGEDEMIDYILKIFKLNNSFCYIDFYLDKLSEEDKENLVNLVPEEDRKLLKANLNIENYSNYFKVEHIRLIPFLTRLSTRENFITFYFTEIQLLYGATTNEISLLLPKSK
ncbi:MAG: hypothetical protein ACLTYB_05750 [Clostridium paraputrificum]